MAYYRCNMLDEHDQVIFPADIVAESLDAAVRHAFRIRETSNHGTSSSRRVYAFQVWSDSGPEFPEALPEQADGQPHLPGRHLVAC
jgi:hypothetical protein